MRRSFLKTALALATSAAALGVHLSSLAQDASLMLKGQVANITCLLVIGTQKGAVSLNLGRNNTAEANKVAEGEDVNPNRYVDTTLKLSAADGSNCDLGSGKWDVGLDVLSTGYKTTSNGTRLLVPNDNAVGKATNIGLSFRTKVVGKSNLSPLDFSNSHPVYGVLMSNNGSTVPSLSSTDSIQLVVRLFRASASAITSGSFSLTIPLNVWYQ
jgi:type 1 fimbria pilin